MSEKVKIIYLVLKIIIISMLISLSLPTTNAATFFNLIQNGDFETGTLSPWICVRGQTPYTDKWILVNTKSHGGSYSAYVQTGGEGGVYALTQEFKTSINIDTIYELSWWYYAESVGHPNGGVEFTLNDGTIVSHFIWGITLNRWVKVDATGTLKGYPGKSIVDIQFYDALETKLWIDDIVIIVNKASLTVKVEGTQGQGLSAARVEIKDSNGTTVFNGFTNEQGIINIVVPFGTYSITVDYKGFKNAVLALVNTIEGTVIIVETDVYIEIFGQAMSFITFLIFIIVITVFIVVLTKKYLLRHLRDLLPNKSTSPPPEPKENKL